MPGRAYEPLTGSPADERTYLMPRVSQRECGLIITAAVAALIAALLMITAVFMHMEYAEMRERAHHLEELYSSTVPPSSTEATPEPPCTSTGCVTAAARILETMDSAADPCADFYQYSCGRFNLASPRPSDLASLNQFAAVARRHRAVMSADLASTRPEDLTGAAGSVRRLYQLCTNMTSRDAAGVDRLTEALERIGGWPALLSLSGSEWNSTAYSWPMAAVLAHAFTGSEEGAPLVRLSVFMDERNVTRHLLHVDQPVLAVTRGLLVDQESHAELHSAYERLITDTMLLLLLPRADGGVSQANETIRAAAEQAAGQIRQFEVQLAQLTVADDQRRNSSRMYNRMTLEELQQLTDDVQPGKIPWTALIGQFLALGHTSDSGPPSNDMEMVVTEPDFFRNLTSLLNATDSTTIANYIAWRVAMSSLEHLGSEAGEILFQFEKVTSGLEAPTPVENRCYDWLSDSMGPGLSYIFITKFFPHDRKNKVETMVSDVSRAFGQRLSNISWMDDVTLQHARDKIEQMVTNVAYREWMANATEIDQYYQGFQVHSDQLTNYASLNRLEIGKNVDLLSKPTDRYVYLDYPSMVNAFYEPTLNSITFPAAVLAPPFFDDSLQVLNYGAIGTVIGHEITHGFDDVGSQYDAVGNLVSWWTAETRAEFMRRADCVRQQYGNFSLPGLQELTDDAHVNGLLTLGENIADNGGLARAHEAYFDQYVSRHGPEPPLPGLEDLTAGQLFFIAFAQTWCSTETAEYLYSHLLSDPHSPRRFRVHGAVSNSADFAAAFSCPRGAPMNPEHKCVVW